MEGKSALNSPETVITFDELVHVGLVLTVAEPEVAEQLSVEGRVIELGNVTLIKILLVNNWIN